MADLKYWISMAGTIVVFIFIVVSLALTVKPVGSQNQSMMAVILTTSILVSLAGWFMGYVLFKGNPEAQVQFLLFFTFVLFMTATVSATTSAFQLYGLRDTVATKHAATA